MVTTPPSNLLTDSSLCFSAASTLFHANSISWDDYLHHCLIHYVKGFPGHGADINHGSRFGEQALLETDPFAHALWCWQGPPYEVDHISQLTCIFSAYKDNSLADLRTRLESLGLERANIFRRALAFLALQDRKLDILEYIVNDGQQYYDPFISGVFEDRAMAVEQASEPELYVIIRRSSWMRHVEQRRRKEKEARPKRRHPDAQAGTPEAAAAAFSDAVPW